MNTMWSVTRENHVYVFWRGKLIYKRWCDPANRADGSGKVFDLYGNPWWADHREQAK